MVKVIGTHWSVFLKSIVSVLGLILALAAAPAQAVMITQSVDFTRISETRGNNPSLDFRALLPRFDPSLGTLDQVDLTYNFDLDLNISVANRTLSPVTADLGPTSLVIEGQRFFDRFSFNRTVASVAIDETLTASAGTQRTIGSITLTLPGRAATSIEVDRTFARTSRPLQIRNIVLRPQGDVSPFVGLDDMVLDFTAFTRTALNLPSSGSVLSGVSSSTSFLLGGSVDVTYDYTVPVKPVEVSEPSTTILMGAGVLAMGFLRRRSRPGRA